MHFLLLLLAAATGFVAAQNETDTGADVDATTDFHACSVQCSGVVLEANPAVATKCNASETADAQTACICDSSKVVSDLQTCLESTCPDLMDGLAAATGFVAAQNETDTGADVDATTDFHACSVQCSGVVLEANPAVATKCNASETADAQTACICESSKVVSDLQTCLESTCPDLMDGVDMQQTCDVLTGKKPVPGTERPDNSALATTAGVATFLTAAGALVAGALLF